MRPAKRRAGESPRAAAERDLDEGESPESCGFVSNPEAKESVPRLGKRDWQRLFDTFRFLRREVLTEGDVSSLLLAPRHVDSLWFLE